MMTLLILKSRIKNFYEKHYLVVRGIMRALIVFISLLVIRSQMNYSPMLGHETVLIVIAIACGFLPDMISVAAIILYTCVEVAQVSYLLAFFIVAVLLIYFLLFNTLGSRQNFIVIAIPILSVLHLGYTVPIVAALFVSPVMLPAVIVGIFFQYMMDGVVQYVAATAGTADTVQTLAALQYLVDYLMQDKMLLISILAFVMTFVCTYLIRKSAIKNSSQIAILVGTILFMTVELLSNIILDLDLNLAGLTIEVVICMVVAYIIQFFHMTLDYHGTRKLQFEDDEYYYYVTAVPKFKVAVVDKTVTRIVPEVTEDTFNLQEELERALEEENDEKEKDSEI